MCRYELHWIIKLEKESERDNKSKSESFVVIDGIQTTFVIKWTESLNLYKYLNWHSTL